jgi:hypothetical protein
MTLSRPRSFAYSVPHARPESLGDLREPTSGVVRVSTHINTALKPTQTYESGPPTGCGRPTVRSLATGTQTSNDALLNRATLLRLLADLSLPKRCQQRCTAQFPELGAQPVRALAA